MTPAPIDPCKKYFIRNHFLNQYLALNQYDLVVERDKVHDGRHEWKFVRVRGGYYIQNVGTKKFLGINSRNNSYGMEDAFASNQPQTFTNVRTQGSYWLLPMGKYFLNCDTNVFNFCNYHGYQTYASSKEGTRRQWAFEPVDEDNGFPKGLAPNVRYKLQNETKPCYLWADGPSRDQIYFHLDDGNVNKVIVFSLLIDGSGGVCLEFNVGFDRPQYLALSSDRSRLFASDDKFYWKIDPKPNSNAYYIYNGYQALSSVPQGIFVQSRSSAVEQSWYFKV